MRKIACDRFLRFYYDCAAYHLKRMGDSKQSLGDHWVSARQWHAEVGRRLLLGDQFRAYQLLSPRKSEDPSVVIGGVLASEYIGKVLIAMGYVVTRNRGKEVRLVDQDVARPTYEYGLDAFFDDQKKATKRSEAAKKAAATRKTQAVQEEIDRQLAINALDAMRTASPSDSVP